MSLEMVLAYESSLVPKPSPAPVHDRLQYTKTFLHAVVNGLYYRILQITKCMALERIKIWIALLC